MTDEQNRAMEIWDAAATALARAFADGLDDEAGEQAAASIIAAALSEKDAEIERLNALADEQARYANVKKAQCIEQADRIRELEGALLQHNDRLRSAAQVANREGADTNWLTFRGAVHFTLAEYHDLVSSILAKHEGTDNDQ